MALVQTTNLGGVYLLISQNNMALADNETPSKWPVILNNGLVDSGIHKALIKQHKCRGKISISTHRHLKNFDDN